MTENPHTGNDVLAFLDSIIPDKPETRLAERQETPQPGQRGWEAVPPRGYVSAAIMVYIFKMPPIKMAARSLTSAGKAPNYRSVWCEDTGCSW